jgi:hypothetical protein
MMLRPTLLLLSMIVCSTAHAQSICRVYEYAELRDMQREKLEAMSCEYLDSMYVMNKVALDEINAGHIVASQRASRDSNRCAQELERIDSALAQFKVKAPVCKKAG